MKIQLLLCPIRYLRLSVVVATLMAAVLMGFSKQTNQSMTYNSLTGKAIYTSIYVKATDSSSSIKNMAPGFIFQ
ncbi:hypothetical protein KFK09_013027 [Dendrobium nobile]|uniref:Uncharacterized protein n=1 Tax=Dendrobium nobile TaxID=94219 RepID=A0A8T3BMH0_DENNO|nr:hypothetical protein KFK09_013027 [Dendrobium nobile]